MGAGDDEGFGDDVADAHTRIKGALRVLENRLNRTTVDPELRLREAIQRLGLSYLLISHDLVAGCNFDHPAKIHDRDSMAEMARCGEVV